ncbi:hypothetical protein CHL78_012190 [Romboutsia weinsteinii]|uniref:DUF5643 domain-containing protein n=1 Tax=Romboutsia weinsteinii TaxID=2020949 RepID=A0A371J1W7_9FIRM|nr:DUF5643 domain-containing protein [Romboutsia weinsteinii]RDY26705.1 hypothetical protein CHL78_012190 [Romboutsia weinsteinii]
MDKNTINEIPEDVRLKLDNTYKNILETEESKSKKALNKIASIIIVGSISIATFPVVAKALHNIELAINNFIESALSEPFKEKLKGKDSAKNMVIYDDNATITLDSSALDNERFVASVTIESDFLKQYKESDQKYSLYAETEVYIGDTENFVGGGASIKLIDENKASLVLYNSVVGKNIEDNVDININLKRIYIKSNEWKSNEVKELEGDWQFSYNLNKVDSIKKIEVKESVEIDGKVITFETIEITPLGNYIRLTADEEIKDIWASNYKIIDNAGNSYRYEMLDGHTDENGWNFTFEVYGDLSDVETLSITPYSGDTIIEQKIHGQDTVKMITNMEKGAQVEDIIVSRSVGKRDLEVETKPASKYEGEKISYNLAIDKERKFYTIEELIGKNIDTGDGKSVSIKDIKSDKENTTITLKVNGDYNYLGQIVLFDEDMKDYYSGIYVTHKGRYPSNSHRINVKDVYYSNTGTATFTIDKIDANKKYKLAVPLQKTINLNSNHTMKAKLK